ncbi:MAG: DUF1501 domain-containing protein [Planctomycetaceae bacterium]|jgi:uncharacterized protein (DUF1501 family)|nr:DUF1501 domain-containing protein [Planctomycetaceae bacterium]
MTEHFSNPLLAQTRRQFFNDCGVGVGKIALASLLANQVGQRSSRAQDATLDLPKPHFEPKVKRVIYLFMAGAPSQLDLFDYKPKLAELEGKPIPPDVVKNQRYAFIRPDSTLLGPRYKFSKHGDSGAEISSIMPHLSEIADDIAIVKSMTTDQFNHAPAQLFLNSGSPIPGRPAMGSWVTYGLESEANDLPGFVVLSTGGGTSGGASNWTNGFLPGRYAGVPFRSQGEPILNVSNPAGLTNEQQRDSLDLIRKLNQNQYQKLNDPQIATRIDAYEMAYRMQTRAPELMDLGAETKETLKSYGAEPGKASFANNCLLARRLIERGVRFINVYHKGWDHHSNVEGGLKGQCGKTDRPAAALVKDLKERGLLDDTLVIWGGEFGRTPMVESSASLGRKLGRDHHPQSYAMWFAGGGIKTGQTIGQTDELGFHITEDRVHVHDLQATILHLLGLDHERLTYTYQGRQFRLTDVHGHLVTKLLS